MTDVTQLLNALAQGDPHAAEELLPLVYQELRKLAAQRMALERPGQTVSGLGSARVCTANMQGYHQWAS